MFYNNMVVHNFLYGENSFRYFDIILIYVHTNKIRTGRRNYFWDCEESTGQLVINVLAVALVEFSLYFILHDII